MANTSQTLGSEQAVLDGLIGHTLTEFEDDSVTRLIDYALAYNDALVTVSLPSLISCGQYAFQECTELESITLPAAVTTLPYALFSGCTKLKTITAPGVTSLGDSVFQNCTGLQAISFPNVRTVGASAFSGCTGIQSLSLPTAETIANRAFGNFPFGLVELPACTSIGTQIGYGNGPSGFDFTQKLTIPAQAFKDSGNMIHLILRSNEVCPLSNVNAFTNTPIGAGFGYIYVPSDLVNTYKAASNWSSFASQIVALSAYPKAPEGSVTMSWAEIDADSSSLSIGDTKVISVGGKFVAVELVGKEKDNLANGQGKAKTTWISVGAIEKRGINISSGVDTTGGYPASALCSYLEETLYPTIENDLKSVIKEVSKKCITKKPSATTVTLDAKLWVPSYKEVGFTESTLLESGGVTYNSKFSDNASRVKRFGGFGQGDTLNWWLRTPSSNVAYKYVQSSGGETGTTGLTSDLGVVIGFCV